MGQGGYKGWVSRINPTMRISEHLLQAGLPGCETCGPNLPGQTVDSSGELSTERDVTTKNRSPFSEPGKPIRQQSLQAASTAKRLIAKEGTHAGPTRGPTTFGRKNSERRLCNSQAKGPSDRSDTGILLAQGIYKVNTGGNGTERWVRLLPPGSKRLSTSKRVTRSDA